MNEWTERDQAEWEVIDGALREYPLAPVPPTLAPAVMQRITWLVPMPRFRLQWIDYALGLFGVGMVGLVLLFWQVLLPNGLLNQVPSTLIPFDVSSMLLWLVSLLAGFVLLAGCVVIAAVVLKPEPEYRVRLVYGRRGIF